MGLDIGVECGGSKERKLTISMGKDTLTSVERIVPTLAMTCNS